MPDLPPDELAKELERLHLAAFGWALHCCSGDRAAAEDALQASYLKVLDGRARFDGRAAFKTWLFGVVRRTAAEERRRAAVWRLFSLTRMPPGADADGRPDPGTAAASDDETARLRGALSGLPGRQREVLHLVFYQDLTIAEAADVLGISLGTARTHYERGKAALRRLIVEDA